VTEIEAVAPGSLTHGFDLGIKAVADPMWMPPDGTLKVDLVKSRTRGDVNGAGQANDTPTQRADVAPGPTAR
jgi:hypothetical protein